MTIVILTLIALLIVTFVFFLLEYRKRKKLRLMMREKNRKLVQQVQMADAVFENTHAFILLVDKNMMVKHTNFYRRTGREDDATPKRVGDLLCCQNAILSGRCGTHPRCAECKINATIIQAFKEERGFPELKTKLVLSVAKDEFAQLEVLVSGAYIHVGNEGNMVLTIHDITELMQHRHEAEKLNNVISYTCALSQTGFASFNLVTNDEVVTPEFLANLGGGNNQSVLDLLANSTAMQPEDKKTLLDFVERARNARVEPLKKEIRIKQKGADRWVRLSLMQKEFLPQENKNEIYCLAVDITHQKEVENNLIQEKEEAEESNKSKSAFLANMSHEIRTPLNAIVGFSELLAGAQSDDEKEQYLGILKMNNEMLLQLINDILDISKIEAGTLEFKYTEVDVNVLMADLERQFKLRMSNKTEVKMIFEPAQPKCNIFIDRNRLGQVISNFMSNAIKFTEVGTIRMGYKLYGDGVYFYVSDTGAGIKKEMLDSVFQRFSRFHKDKKGNGLGLAICKTIIEKMGGTIGVESTYQRGTTFWFILPEKPTEAIIEDLVRSRKRARILAATEEAELEEATATFTQEIDAPTYAPTDAPAPAPEATEEEAAPARKEYSILIAEDSDERFDAMAAVLSINYAVERAHNGEEAIMHFFQNPPSLILMALQLPDVDGYQATEAIRQMSTTLPIVALTDEEPADADTILKAGFTDILVRPVERDPLMDTVFKMLK